MGDALLIEVLEANQTTAAENERLKEQNKSLKEHIARNESEISFLETFIEGLQSTIACLRNELDETNTKTMEALRLMARNLDYAKQKLVKATQKNEVLQANQEIHMGVISDLKREILEGKIEKNQMEKDFTNTTENYPEPFVMEFKSICSSQPVVCLPPPSFNPFHESGDLDNYRNTTRC